MTTKAKQLINIIENLNIQEWVMNEWRDINLRDDNDEIIPFTDDDHIFSYLKGKFEFEEFERIEQVCNSDEMYTVIYFKESDIYLKLIGEYDSYGNNDHNYTRGIIEVKPISKTIIAYE